MKSAIFSETLTSIHMTTWAHNTEDHSIKYLKTVHCAVTFAQYISAHKCRTTKPREEASCQLPKRISPQNNTICRYS